MMASSPNPFPGPENPTSFETEIVNFFKAGSENVAWYYFLIKIMSLIF